jgi:protein involved in polysaccharide export with SLBB domain
MKRQIAPLLLTIFLAAALRPLAQAQDNSTGMPGSSPYPQSQSGSVDCTDPLEADSAQCTVQTQGTNPYGSQNGYPAPNSTPGMPGMPGMPSTGLPNPQMQNPGYADNGSLSRQQYPYQSPYQQRPTETLPPELLTEFQKFVASTTGQVLPIYGADLFRRVPSTFSPLDLSPVPSSYTIGPDDELRIRVWGQVNFRADVRVLRSGDIYLPQVGQVHVAGIPYSDLDAHLRQALARVYKNFDLTAEVGQIRSIQVYLAGAARRPGVYTVSSLSTLVDALFSSGGPSTSGSLRHIELRRNGAVITDFDLYALLIHGDKSKDSPLQSGDVIFIPPVGPQVALYGSVRNPALYELREGESLADALADAGGVSTVAAEARVSIERISDHRDRYAMEVAWDATGMKTPLADGDLVQVLSILPKYQKTVILRGNTANPGRFAWHPDMRLSDLIPDKESLITRNYWWRRARLGMPTPEFEPLENFPNLRQPTTPIVLTPDQLGGPVPVTSATGFAPGMQPMGNGQTSSNQGFANNSQGGALYGLDTNGTMQGTNAGGYPVGQRTANTGQPGDPSNQQQGQTAAPQRTDVGPMAPEIDWDYAVIQRQGPATLKTILIPFDLGRLVLQHDTSQDMALQAGDVVTVFSQADIHVPIAAQTKYVRLDGEFVHAGIYTVEPGETLRDLVTRAGGFTSSAYLYGSEFTRVSTRILQQHRMDEYIQTQETQMERGNLALASSPVSSAQDLASGAAAQTSEQQLLSELRQMRATGRIVLELRPGSAGIDSLPDITLENGDHFIVPPVPAAVNVVGAVFDQNSFLYENARRSGDYLHLSGGPNPDADRKDIFIIRADGSVVSRASASGPWGNQFDRLRMSPGDTIVVPEKSFKPSALRGFLDWSQLFSQFALGAAAISVIHQ